MGTFSALLAICAGNSPVPGEFPTQRPMTRSFDVLFDLRLNKRLSKQSWGWCFETLSRPLWRHCNEECKYAINPTQENKTMCWVNSRIITHEVTSCTFVWTWALCWRWIEILSICCGMCCYLRPRNHSFQIKWILQHHLRYLVTLNGNRNYSWF